MDKQPLPESLQSFKPVLYNIAQDLAMCMFTSTFTVKDVQENYGIDPVDFVVLTNSKEFGAAQKKVTDRITALGESAPTTLRAQMIAASILEDVYVHAMSPSADLKDKIKLLERTFQYAGLDPATNGQNKQKPDTGPANQIIINVPPGIPGLQHIYDNQGSGDGK